MTLTDDAPTTTTTTNGNGTSELLPEALLEEFRRRAAGYDRTNTFFQEDFDELRKRGYYAANVPRELGGLGLGLAEMGHQQRRLARYAPATALATSMHLYWTGLAAEAHRMGATEHDWILTDAAAGEIFAAGHAESGNDVPVALSTARAERVEGGYRFYGRKHFGSLSPVWTRFGVHALDASDPENPVIVQGFVDRADPGYEIVDVWDTLGMRATQSHDTRLDGVFVPDARIGRVVPAGDGSDPFIGAMAMWPLSLIATVYLGIAERALELAVDGARRKTSVVIDRGAYAYHPMIQHQIAEMYLELDSATATVDRFVADWVAGVDHGDAWVPKVYAQKWRAVEAAKRVVDIALDVSGGGGMFRGNELERLYRDVRCGGFHPGNDALTHEVVGKALLGVLGEQPRW